MGSWQRSWRRGERVWVLHVNSLVGVAHVCCAICATGVWLCCLMGSLAFAAPTNIPCHSRCCNRCGIAPSYASKLVAAMRELQRRRQATNVFAGVCSLA